MDSIETGSQTLNLPVLPQLTSCKNLLIAGMGGGFDVFCGLPIYFTLRDLGCNVHLANLSFTMLCYQKDGIRLSPNLIGVTGETRNILPYFPEWHLAKWFLEEEGEAVPLWCLELTDARLLQHSYRRLIDHLEIDGILLIDGGVDSLMHGDEEKQGTLLEDALSLAVVRSLPEIPMRMIGCLGLGAEQDISYAHVFENMAELIREGAFFGSCSLTQAMEVCGKYERAVEYVFRRMPADSSVINASVVSAVRGHFGDYHLTDKTKGSNLWINPLMPIYWFFDFEAVCRRNLFLDTLMSSLTLDDAVHTFYHHLKALRAYRRVPL